MVLTKSGLKDANEVETDAQHFQAKSRSNVYEGLK